MSIKQKGGTVNNPANTAISGYTYGVEIYGAAGTVTNSGMITSNSVSTGFGVYLQDGGTVTNSGVIFGGGPKGQGVKLLSGKVTNESRGVIQGFTYAVDMGGGTVTNNAGGSIVAAEVGVAFQLNAGSLTNAGVINVQPVVQSTSVFGVLAFIGPGVDVVNSGSITATGTGQNSVYGVKIATNAYLTNTGTITAQDGTKSWGVYLWNVAGGAATVVNSGTITGATAAIQFGAKTNKLILETRSVLNGAAIGSTSKGATNALVLEGSGTANNAFLNFNTLSVMASGTWTLGGALKIGATTVTTGSLDIAGALTTNMTEAAAASVIVGVGGALTLTAASTLSGAFSVQADSLVTLSGGALNLTGTATFSGGATAGSRALDNSASATLSHLTIGGTGGFVNDDFVLETANVILGDALGDTTSITNMAGAGWSLTNDAGIALGKSAASSITNFGLFEKTADVGASVIAPAFVNDGKVEVWTHAGAINFHGAVTGTGTDVIFGGAELEFYSTVAKTQTVDFVGSGGSVLFLGAPTSFSAALSGFDASVSNDAVELLGSWSISGFSTTSTRSTLTLTDGSQSASLVFDGSYSKSLFEAAVGSTHTTVTYT